MSRRLLIRDERGERERLLVGTMTVGRDPRCDISDADPLLSRRHAEFVSAPGGVIVRDLNSRNGIAVNGARVYEAVLKPGDVVKIAKLVMTYMGDIGSPVEAGSSRLVVDERSPASPSSEAVPLSGPMPAVSGTGGAEAESDATRLFPRESRAIQHQTPTRTEVAAEIDDRTRLIPRRSGQRATASEEEILARMAPVTTTGAANPAPSLPPSALVPDDADKTRLMAPRKSVVAPKPSEAPFATSPVRQPARTAQQPDSVRRPWSRQVSFAIVGLACAVFLMTAALMTMWQRGIVQSYGRAEAIALVNWLAADTRAVLQAQGPAGLGGVAEDVRRQPNVVAAHVVLPDGRVADPESASGGPSPWIPGLNIAAEAVQAPQSAWHDGVIEAVAPVRVANGDRTAVAWVTYRPRVPAETSSAVVVLGPLLFLSIVAGLIVAGVIRRNSVRSLTALQEDVESAVARHIDNQGNSPGAETAPATPSDGEASPVAAGTVEMREGAAPRWQREATLAASAEFRVTEASQSCREVLGVASERLVGLHLIDAFADRATANAVLQCLSALSTGSGTKSAVVTPADRPFPLAIEMTRTGKDQPIRLVLRMIDTAAAP